MRTSLLTFLALLLWAVPAAADETEGARLFREGRAAMLDGHFDVACPKIAESQRLEPHVGTLLNLAACHERQGKVASAWVEYQKALTAARADGQPERARLAQRRIDVLEPRVPWLNIVPPLAAASSELVVTLDGAIVQPVAWGKEMPVDPGPHVVGARTPGKPSFEESLELHEGEHATSSLDLDRGQPVPPDGAAPRVVVDPNPEPSTEAPKPSGPRSRWVFEPGLFIGFLSVATDRAQANAPGSISVSNGQGTSSTNPEKSCASVGCSYALGTQPGAVVGPNLFAGYALSDDFTAGLRLVAAPRLDRGGGSIAAFGPSIRFNAGSIWSFGAWALLGSATVGSPNGGTVDANAPYRASQGYASMTASTNLGVGLGFETSLRIVSLPRGSLVLTATPFFVLGSNGSALTLPLGVAYHFP